MNDFINLRTSNRKVFYSITRLLRLYYAILRLPSISAFCCLGIQFCIQIAADRGRSNFHAKPRYMLKCPTTIRGTSA